MTRQVTTFSQAAAAATLRTARIWPRAAVLDCDGLLVDTHACWHAAYRSAAERAGASLNGFDLGFLDGASTTSAAARLTQTLGRPITSETITRTLHHALATFPVRAMPGAERLLSVLAAELPLAVASNAPMTAVRMALARAGLDRLVPTIVSAQDSGIFKPHPDVYLRACRQLRVDPSDAIALEDSAVGARAARAAGLTVIVVRAGLGVRRYADLSVPRLDEPRVFELFGLHPPITSGRPGAIARPASQ